MANYEELQPERVFHYFREISQIPRDSGKTGEIADYLLEFARLHGLRSERDEANNVVIWKDGNGSSEKPVILQGHIDMVCVSDNGHDFEHDPLELKTDGEWLWAEGTSLGGDDGIAVASMLAILEDTELKHPPIEAVFTSDEEIGMIGASKFDYSVLKGRRMLNLDSEDEGILTAGCAGGLVGISSLPLERKVVERHWYQLRITGLAGGHSGTEINKGRANSNILAGRILSELAEEIKISLAGLEGGLKDNAIAAETVMTVGIRTDEEADFPSLVQDVEDELRAEFRGTDDGIRIEIGDQGRSEQYALRGKSFRKVIRYLRLIPNGVQKMSGEIEGLVQTSCNLGILKMEENKLLGFCSIRSALESAKWDLSRRAALLTDFLDGVYEEEGAYPAWEYMPESPFRDRVVSIYEEVTGIKPVVNVIHAGVECGMFYKALPGLEAISMGPNIRDIHTTGEHLDIASAERFYQVILEVLRQSADE